LDLLKCPQDNKCIDWYNLELEGEGRVMGNWRIKYCGSRD
jgi:hypothetical protein